MKKNFDKFLRIILLAVTWLIWWWMLNLSLSNNVNLCIIIGSMVLIFPVVWLGRVILDRQPTLDRTVRITTFVHYGVGILLGSAVIRAVMTHQDWTGWVLPVPAEIGLVLVIISGAAGLFSVINLAIKGLGAPFAIALSEKVAVDWMYAWTRNPMVLSGLALLLSLGLYYQSALFVLWVLILCAPALLTFVKVYEERELEIRFGESYLAYKARTPLLFPRKPRG